MRFHVVAGLPRAGSTLLQNLLNQNPRFRCSSTSSLPILLSAMQSAWSHSPEIKSDLINDREGTFERMRATMRAAVEAWHDHGAEVAFDKSRLWVTQLRLLEWLCPDARMIVCVRDLRDVLASIEKEHAATAVLDESQTPLGRTAFERASQLFSTDGIVGSCVSGLDDLLRRKPACVHVVKFEELVAHPRTELSRIYEELGEDPFEHDVEYVSSTADDVDALYHHKFPHVGEGKVEPRGTKWQEWVSPDLSEQILTQFRGYNQAFGYGV